ncbi:hypothetical protein [Streptomyces massasporeus]|uniref:hypothetical protein n=1 Tax=Streptomyces massasporeus TaxID=67324 RepID=UPI001674C35A|nr:hypothetical protein [Streptomyces massasporeus]
MFDMQGGPDLYPCAEGREMKKNGANELLAAGVKTYCPKHLDTMTEELRASGEF